MDKPKPGLELVKKGIYRKTASRRKSLNTSTKNKLDDLQARIEQIIELKSTKKILKEDDTGPNLRKSLLVRAVKNAEKNLISSTPHPAKNPSIPFFGNNLSVVLSPISRAQRESLQLQKPENPPEWSDSEIQDPKQNVVPVAKPTEKQDSSIVYVGTEQVEDAHILQMSLRKSRKDQSKNRSKVNNTFEKPKTDGSYNSHENSHMTRSKTKKTTKEQDTCTSEKPHNGESPIQKKSKSKIPLRVGSQEKDKIKETNCGPSVPTVGSESAFKSPPNMDQTPKCNRSRYETRSISRESHSDSEKMVKSGHPLLNDIKELTLKNDSKKSSLMIVQQVSSKSLIITEKSIESKDRKKYDDNEEPEVFHNKIKDITSRSDSGHANHQSVNTEVPPLTPKNDQDKCHEIIKTKHKRQKKKAKKGDPMKTETKIESTEKFSKENNNKADVHKLSEEAKSSKKDRVKGAIAENSHKSEPENQQNYCNDESTVNKQNVVASKSVGLSPIGEYVQQNNLPNTMDKSTSCLPDNDKDIPNLEIQRSNTKPLVPGNESAKNNVQTCLDFDKQPSALENIILEIAAKKQARPSLPNLSLRRNRRTANREIQTSTNDSLEKAIPRFLRHSKLTGSSFKRYREQMTQTSVNPPNQFPPSNSSDNSHASSLSSGLASDVAWCAFNSGNLEKHNIYESLEEGNELDALDFSDSNEPHISAINNPWRFEKEGSLSKTSNSIKLNFIRSENDISGKKTSSKKESVFHNYYADDSSDQLYNSSDSDVSCNDLNGTLTNGNVDTFRNTSLITNAGLSKTKKRQYIRKRHKPLLGTFSNNLLQRSILDAQPKKNKSLPKITSNDGTFISRTSRKPRNEVRANASLDTSSSSKVSENCVSVSSADRALLGTRPLKEKEKMTLRSLNHECKEMVLHTNNIPSKKNQDKSPSLNHVRQELSFTSDIPENRQTSIIESNVDDLPVPVQIESVPVNKTSVSKQPSSDRNTPNALSPRPSKSVVKSPKGVKKSRARRQPDIVPLETTSTGEGTGRPQRTRRAVTFKTDILFEYPGILLETKKKTKKQSNAHIEVASSKKEKITKKKANEAPMSKKGRPKKTKDNGEIDTVPPGQTEDNNMANNRNEKLDKDPRQKGKSKKNRQQIVDAPLSQSDNNMIDHQNEELDKEPRQKGRSKRNRQPMVIGEIVDPPSQSENDMIDNGNQDLGNEPRQKGRPKRIRQPIKDFVHDDNAIDDVFFNDNQDNLHASNNKSSERLPAVLSFADEVVQEVSKPQNQPMSPRSLPNERRSMFDNESMPPPASSRTIIHRSNGTGDSGFETLTNTKTTKKVKGKKKAVKKNTKAAKDSQEQEDLPLQTNSKNLGNASPLELSLTSIRDGSVTKNHKKINNAEVAVNNISKALQRCSGCSMSNLHNNPTDTLNGQSDPTMTREIGRSRMLEKTIGDYISCAVEGNVFSLKCINRSPSNYKKVGTLDVSETVKDPKDNFSAGYMRLQPGESKPSYITTKYSFIYNVINGKAWITCHNIMGTLQQGEFFFVPIGMEYSIQNIDSTDLILTYIKLKGVN